jgi:alkylation response protein AidB-like acyl-CoA dehydrogenase
MNLELTSSQASARAAFNLFARQEIAPFADQYDHDEQVPMDVIRSLSGRGYLGLFLPQEWGGGASDMITYGLLNEEIGRACSSVRSLITVHGMVAQAILKWGSDDQRKSWLPRLASGQTLGAFAATEANVGSDLNRVETTAERVRDGYVLNGRKRWVTFGQIADLFLVLASCDDKPTTFLIERHRSNLSTQPIRGMLGVRASMLADVQMEDCWIPEENLVGREGFGLLAVISDALSLGRYSVAWGCVGIAQACLEAALHYTSERKQFGILLREHQLIQEMIGEMVTGVKAARLLCCRAGYLKDMGDAREVMETFVAKYFASRAAMKAALDAVQIHGANGCSSQYPVQRYLRDAKVMEIIEGSNQIQQITISSYGYQEYAQLAFERTAGAESGRAGKERAGKRT